MNTETLELRVLQEDELPQAKEVEGKGCCVEDASMAIYGSNRAQRRKYGVRCKGYTGPLPERIL